jgi:hypothetical protein
MPRFTAFTRQTRTGVHVSTERVVPDTASLLSITGDFGAAVLAGNGELEFALQVQHEGVWKTYVRATWKAPTTEQPQISIDLVHLRGMTVRVGLRAPRAIAAGLFLDID